MGAVKAVKQRIYHYDFFTCEIPFFILSCVNITFSIYIICLINVFLYLFFVCILTDFKNANAWIAPLIYVSKMNAK